MTCLLSICEQVCTFADNHRSILRCAACDSVKGTPWDYYLSQPDQAQQEGPGPPNAQTAPAGACSSGAATTEQPPATASQGLVAGVHGNDQRPEATGRQGADSSRRAAEVAASLPGSASRADEEDAGAAGSSMWEPGEHNGWVCRRCGQNVSEEQKAEHEDYHMALQLQEAEGRPGGPETSHRASQPAGNVQGTAKKRKATEQKRPKNRKSSQVMDAFLKRANAKCS